MSIVTDTRYRALDSNGNPMSGATLTIYTAGTTTPASIYRDGLLATPMSNPTSGADTANSSGYFPQIFAAEGLTFDILLKNSSGVLQTSYLSVPSLGTTTTGTIIRDFAAGGRLVISGAAGVVSFEGGPPTGDDIGGAVRVGGYLGTQADTISLDALATSTTGTLNSAGALTENAHPVNVTLSSGAISGSSLIVALPTGYRGYTLELTELVPSTSASMYLTCSVDGGATYLAGTSYYYDWFLMVGGVGSGATATGGSLLPLTGSGTMDSQAARHHSIFIDIDTPLSGTFDTHLACKAMWSTVSLWTILTNGHLKGSTRVDHIKIVPSAGTFTGRYRLISRRD